MEQVHSFAKDNAKYQYTKYSVPEPVIQGIVYLEKRGQGNDNERIIDKKAKNQNQVNEKNDIDHNEKYSPLVYVVIPRYGCTL